MTMITSVSPITPAVNVLFKEDSPKEASTVFEEISVSFVGKLPELILLTSVFTSSVVKFP